MCLSQSTNLGICILQNLIHLAFIGLKWLKCEDSSVELKLLVPVWHTWDVFFHRIAFLEEIHHFSCYMLLQFVEKAVPKASPALECMKTGSFCCKRSTFSDPAMSSLCTSQVSDDSHQKFQRWNNRILRPDKQLPSGVQPPNAPCGKSHGSYSVCICSFHSNAEHQPWKGNLLPASSFLVFKWKITLVSWATWQAPLSGSVLSGRWIVDHVKTHTQITINHESTGDCSPPQSKIKSCFIFFFISHFIPSLSLNFSPFQWE